MDPPVFDLSLNEVERAIDNLTKQYVTRQSRLLIKRAHAVISSLDDKQIVLNAKLLSALNSLTYINPNDRKILSEFLANYILPIAEVIVNKSTVLNDINTATYRRLQIENLLPNEPELTFIRLGGRLPRKDFYNCIVDSGGMSVHTARNKFVVHGQLSRKEFIAKLQRNCATKQIVEPRLLDVINYRRQSYGYPSPD